VNDEFLKKNYRNGVLRTEDLLSEPIRNKENKRKSSRKKKITKEEIAKSNSKIGSFFQATSSKKKKTKTTVKSELIDLVDASSNNKIVEEVQDEVKILKNNKIVEEIIIDEEEQKDKKQSNDSNDIYKNYSPPKLKILENQPLEIQKEKKSNISFNKEPNKEDFPWKDKLFVVTGKLHTSDDRKDLQTFLTFWGMTKRTSVSRKTDILIHGHILDDGRDYKESNKYKKAKKFENILIVSEEGLDKIFKSFTGYSLQENFNKYNENIDNYPKNLYQDCEEEIEFEIEEQEENNDKIGKNCVKINWIEEENLNKGKKKKIESSFNMMTKHKGRLWADIFAPKKITQLIGNSVNIKKFKDWMYSWESSKRAEIRNLSSTNKKKKPKIKDGKLFSLRHSISILIFRKSQVQCSSSVWITWNRENH
jgi:hypothetical protein